MGFSRRGFNGAQPTFRLPKGFMGTAADLAKFEVGDGTVTGFKAAKADDSVYRYDIRSIDHPIARAVEEIPAMVAMLREMIPTNVCLTNRNIADDLNIPMDVPMGDLRKIAAILARIDATSAEIAQVPEA